MRGITRDYTVEEKNIFASAAMTHPLRRTSEFLENGGDRNGAGEVVKSASDKAFLSLPSLAKAVSELTVLKGVGPATASAVLAAYAPDVAPFMSGKWKELSSEGEPFTASDVERARWSSTIGAKLLDQSPKQ